MIVVPGGSAAQADPIAGGSAFGDTTFTAKRLGDRVPLRRGMRGRDVRALQRLFVRIDLRVARDGRFGAGTHRAVRRFEKRAGRPVDGVLDRRDIVALRRIAAEGGFRVRQAQVEPAAGSKARLNPDGTASPPADAPKEVVEIIEAANEIATKPYRYGGGHGSWKDSGYDCSGSVSYALHGAGLLDAPRASGGFTRYGSSGPGRWVTIYANGGHMYMVVAGLRFDTSGRDKAGTRWQSDMRSSAGYAVRHPNGL